MITFVSAPVGPGFNTTGKTYETTTPSGAPLRPMDLYPKDTAAQIRRVLKAAFPGITFSVTTGRGSGVSSVDVRWTDGPTVAEVHPFLWPFKAGSFDGMTDSYTYDRDRKVYVDGVLFRPCCQYVQASRNISAALANRCIARIAAWWGGIDQPPVAVANQWGGYTLTPDVSNDPVRSDLGGGGWMHEYTWAVQVRRCAEDPGKYVRDIADIDLENEVSCSFAIEVR